MLPATILAGWEEGNWRTGETTASSVITRQSPVEKQPFGFMDFPGEVRNMIYPHLLISPLQDPRGAPASGSTTFTCGLSRDSANYNGGTRSGDEAPEDAAKTAEDPQRKETEGRHLYPNILATNRRINIEATPLLYALNTFTATITSSAFKTTHSPPLYNRSHRYIPSTCSWTIIIDLVASTPAGWADPEWDWQQTIDEGIKVVNAIKKRVRKACRALQRLEALHTVRIEVVDDYGWQLRSRLVGVGIVKLLEEFKSVRAEDVEIEGADAVVPRKRIEDVRMAMLGVVDPAEWGGLMRNGG